MSELIVEPVQTCGHTPQIATIASPGAIHHRATAPDATFVPVSDATVKLPNFDAKIQPSIRYSAGSVPSISDSRTGTSTAITQRCPSQLDGGLSAVNVGKVPKRERARSATAMAT